MKKIVIIFIAVFSITCLVALFFYLHQKDQEFFDETSPSFMYTDFGVYVPTQFSIYGIDVSRHQNRINWKEVKKMKVQNIEIDFVFIKATEGKFMKDKRFKENWKEAKQNGITRGAYHFYLPDGSPETQATNFMESVKLLPGDLPPVIDIEDRGVGAHKAFIANIKIFIDDVSDYCDCKPIIYTYDSFYDDYLRGQFTGYPLWIARYGAEKPEEDRFSFWQFSDKARVDGIGPKVDMNVFSGDSAAFSNLLIQEIPKP